MIKIIKVWYLTSMIKLCNFALSLKEGAEHQNDINGVIETKNNFIKELSKLKGGQECRKQDNKY